MCMYEHEVALIEGSFMVMVVHLDHVNHKVIKDQVNLVVMV